MLKSKKLWLGLAVSALFLTLFLYRIDYSETWDALRGANYLYVVPAIAVYFGSLWFRTIRWQYLMKHLTEVSISRLYPVTIVGYMANNILPVRLGEVVRSYYLSTRERISTTSALGTVGVDRVFDGLTLIFFLLVIWPSFPSFSPSLAPFLLSFPLCRHPQERRWGSALEPGGAVAS